MVDATTIAYRPADQHLSYGLFHFDHASLETTMRQLAGWYDVTVEYQSKIAPQEFVGKIQRSMMLAAVLKGLEGENVHFVLEGKQVTVTPSKNSFVSILPANIVDFPV